MISFITKSSGKSEAFDVQKLQRSLKKAGASHDIIKQITHEIQQIPTITSTKDIYDYAFKRLKQIRPALAAWYKLKTALMQLGPSGYPFEKFLARLFNQIGFSTVVDHTIQGRCVDHEIDVIGKHDQKTLMIESKFHNRHGPKTDIKVAL